MANHSTIAAAAVSSRSAADLPAAGCDPAHVRLADMWGSAEAQELAQVSPDMHEEFSLRYERPLLASFGLTGYGCCEDLTRKLGLAKTIGNLRRVSISPFADVDACAERLGVDPKECYVVGDAVWDLLAARRAEMLSIGLMSGGYGDDELTRAGAYRVYRDAAELNDSLDELGVLS